MISEPGNIGDRCIKTGQFANLVGLTDIQQCIATTICQKCLPAIHTEPVKLITRDPLGYGHYINDNKRPNTHSCQIKPIT